MTYVDLQVTTNYSFLRGASFPREMVAAAAVLGHETVAITDRNTLAGIVKAYDAVKTVNEQQKTQIKLVTGCRLDLTSGESLLCYPQDRAAYSRLVRLLTVGKRRAEKGQCHLTYDDVVEYGEGQLLIALGDHANEALRGFLQKLRSDFRDRSYMALTRRFRPNEVQRLSDLAALAADCRVQTVATNDVLYHAPERRMLQDVVTCIRLGRPIDELGHDREWSADRFFKPPAEMTRLFKLHPEAVERTAEIAARCRFALDQLKYQYPDENLFPGFTAQEGLEQETWKGAAFRYPDGIPEKVQEKVKGELKIIAELGYAPYFLTVWRIVQYARSIGILCQGRGSAANSAVCYCLRITEINPMQRTLLFERFVSASRNEPPDIDVDFEHERREEVIQWIYKTYGRERAALTATVIHYRSRRAVREVAKALGLPEDTAAVLAKSVWGWSEEGIPESQARNLGLDPTDYRLKLLLHLSQEITGFPRHLSQHPGGFVITQERLDDLVPIENATMEDRTVIEWDKDDIELLHMMKVDVLGLGMLGCLRCAFDLLSEHKGLAYTVDTLPKEDPAVYDMLCEADSIGVFQVESRAQMSMLPRLRPRNLNDLVIEVAIVRPGPIQGDMVHPYLRRREGKEKATYHKEELREVLKSTLGVPLFQEQAMQIAIVGAGFSANDADLLRRAMATFRNDGNLQIFREKFIKGMVEREYPLDFAQRCFSQIEGFGTYGFPESHAASFALLVYASAYIKCRHPEVFLCAILNAQPMGFYAPAQLIRDALDHDVKVLPVDINASRWDCTLEWQEQGVFAVRLGFRMVPAAANEIMAKIPCPETPYENIEDVWRRTGVPAAQLEKLAEADAFASLGYNRREALWIVKSLSDIPLPLFMAADQAEGFDRPETVEERVALRSLTAAGEVIEDYAILAFSLRAHPLSLVRGELTRQRWKSMADLRRLKDGDRVRIAGLVLVRQRPGTASGIVFITLEDETGVGNLVVWSTVFDTYRSTIMTADILGCVGRVQREGEIIHVVADSLYSLNDMLTSVSKDGRKVEITQRDTYGTLTADPREMRFHSRDFH
ncbi:MAG: error-prone DNA polymerase [Rhodospirillaceae bacterium]